MVDEALSRQFWELYEQWGAAIANKDHDWLEDFFADDFLGTAQPWPTLNVDKQQMIALDKDIEKMDTNWVHVVAHKLGDTVVTLGLVKYNNEEFKPGSTVAEGMPTGDEISSLTKGKVVAYINGWRHNGERWQVFDHHMVGIVDNWEA
ncbi:MAG: hypothetical protein CMI63_17525 [Parvularcula sp.]|nr:hypothetical protein [Parvularcula sp.]